MPISSYPYPADAVDRLQMANLFKNMPDEEITPAIREKFGLVFHNDEFGRDWQVKAPLDKTRRAFYELWQKLPPERRLLFQIGYWNLGLDYLEVISQKNLAGLISAESRDTLRMLISLLRKAMSSACGQAIVGHAESRGKDPMDLMGEGMAPFVTGVCEHCGAEAPIPAPMVGLTCMFCHRGVWREAGPIEPDEEKDQS